MVKHIKNIRLSIFFFLFAAFVLTIIYFPYLKNDPILSRDDKSLISPLRVISSLPEYFEAVKTNKILDFQPIRDLSLFIDIQIANVTGVSFFHISSLIMLLIAAWVLVKILNELKFSEMAVGMSVLIFLFHPLMVSAAGWISSRKHILGLIFILLSTLSVIKSSSIRKKSIFYYCMATLSHQIFILFPVWVWLYLKANKNKINYYGLITLVLLGGFILFLSCYKLFYLGMGNNTAAAYGAPEILSRYILSIGRSVSLIFVPLVISAAYFQGSPYNLIGIPLLILFLFSLYKCKNNKIFIPWMTFALLVHIPTVIAFVNDTYLYLPLVCTIITINFAFKGSTKKWSSLYLFVPIIVVCLLLVKTIQASKMWFNDKNLWQYSFEQEPSPYNSLMLGFALLRLNRDLGYEFLHSGAKHYDFTFHAEAARDFLTTIHASPLPFEKKIEILNDSYVDRYLYQAYYAMVLLEGNTQQRTRGIEVLKLILNTEAIYTAESDKARIIYNIKQLCLFREENKHICKELKIKL